MMQFEHETLGQRVRFGSGNAAGDLAAEIEMLGADRVMVIAAEPEHQLAMLATSGISPALWWDEVAQHVPIEVARSARQAAARERIDVLVSVGGGSTTGLAKAIALEHGIPIIAIPTTYAGSEATNVWGLTEDRTKVTGTDPRVLPAVVVYDAELSRSLPLEMSVASGLNGMAHCVDSLWAPRADPINRVLAIDAARALAAALRGITLEPEDLTAREQALYGSYLAAVSFASAGSGLHHKICHVLGGTFELPHAQTHAAVLPYVLALNAPAVPGLAKQLAEVLAVPGNSNISNGMGENNSNLSEAAITALTTLYREVDAPSNLADYGFTAAHIPEATDRILEVAPESNPTPVTRENITELLEAALAGTRPTVVTERSL